MTVPRRVDGVDISHHQASVNMGKLKAAGVQWLYHKATEGTTFVDEDYAARKRMADDAGMPFGGYHFALANGSAKAEANHFKSVLGDTDLQPCLDLERTGGRSRKNLTGWVEEFLYTMGEPCVIYTPYALDDYFGSVRWRPRYNSENDPPHLSWDIWQFSNGQVGQPASVPAGANGASYHCDLNTHRVGFTIDDLMREGNVDYSKLADAVWDHELANYLTAGTSKAGVLLSKTHKRTADTLALVSDPASFAAQIAALLPVGGAVTVEQLTEALTAVLGSVDN